MIGCLRSRMRESEGNLAVPSFSYQPMTNKCLIGFSIIGLCLYVAVLNLALHQLTTKTPGINC